MILALLVAVLCGVALVWMERKPRIRRMIAIGTNIEQVARLLGDLRPRITITDSTDVAVSGIPRWFQGQFPEFTGAPGLAKTSVLAPIAVPIGFFGVLHVGQDNVRVIHSTDIQQIEGSVASLAVRLVPQVQVIVCDTEESEVTATSAGRDFPVHAYATCLVTLHTEALVRLSANPSEVHEFVQFVGAIRREVVQPAMVQALKSKIERGQLTHQALVRKSHELRADVQRLVAENSRLKGWTESGMLDVVVGALVLNADARVERTLRSNLATIHAALRGEATLVEAHRASLAAPIAKVNQAAQRIRLDLEKIQTEAIVWIHGSAELVGVTTNKPSEITKRLGGHVSTHATKIAAIARSEEDEFQKAIRAYWNNCLAEVQALTDRLTTDIEFLIEEAKRAQQGR